jgi:protein O-GlcNAc transferase
LWGNDPKYVVGAQRNAELAAKVYPGWTCRFYCGSSVGEDARRRLRGLAHVEVVEMPEPGDWRGMFWRFQPAAEPQVEVMLSRDTDSRLGERERAAVDAWLASGAGFHVMRDHPDHLAPILGGLWGVRQGRLPEMSSLIDGFPKEDRWQTDQEFLAAVIAPLVRSDWLEHDPYFSRKPFPTRRRGREFVGQPFDADDRALVIGPRFYEERIRHGLAGWPRLAQILRSIRSRLARSRAG